MIGLGLGLWLGAQGSGLPPLPSGYSFLVLRDGTYLTNASGDYYIVRA